eukprot:SAG11_NODE_36755_length_260_cov_0.633540_1_plen_61_part_01
MRVGTWSNSALREAAFISYVSSLKEHGPLSLPGDLDAVGTFDAALVAKRRAAMLPPPSPKV